MIWKQDSLRAHFVLADWRGTVDLANPDAGLSIQSPHRDETANCLQVLFAPPHLPHLEECFIRQSDLIVVYPPREQRKFQIQLDYRVLDALPESLLIELWVSIQTYLLDSHPHVSIRLTYHPTAISFYRADPVNRIVEQTLEDDAKLAVIVGKTPGNDLHFAWLIHPRDQSDSMWKKDDRESAITAGLFGHFMEKGVIRRGRMRYFLSRSSIPPVQLQELYMDLVRSPLPLTA